MYQAKEDAQAAAECDPAKDGNARTNEEEENIDGTDAAARKEDAAASAKTDDDASKAKNKAAVKKDEKAEDPDSESDSDAELYAITSDVFEQYFDVIMDDVFHHYYVSHEYTPEFFRRLAYEGFISVTHEQGGRGKSKDDEELDRNELLLPEIQRAYCVMRDFDSELHFGKKTRKLWRRLVMNGTEKQGAATYNNAAQRTSVKPTPKVSAGTSEEGTNAVVRLPSFPNDAADRVLDDASVSKGVVAAEANVAQAQANDTSSAREQGTDQGAQGATGQKSKNKKRRRREQEEAEKERKEAEGQECASSAASRSSAGQGTGIGEGDSNTIAGGDTSQPSSNPSGPKAKTATTLTPLVVAPSTARLRMFVNRNFDHCWEFLNKFWHGQNWLTRKYAKTMQRSRKGVGEKVRVFSERGAGDGGEKDDLLSSRKRAKKDKNKRGSAAFAEESRQGEVSLTPVDDGTNLTPHSIEIYLDNELIAGEMGYSIGSIYTSLSGFVDREKGSGVGTLQLVLLGKWLQERGYSFWNLGHPPRKTSMKYKADLGGKVIPRGEFLDIWRKARDDVASTTASAASVKVTESEVTSKRPFVGLPKQGEFCLVNFVTLS